MVSVIRRWIVDQLMLGEFASYRDVCRKSVWVALKVSLVAYGLISAAISCSTASACCPTISARR